MGVALEEVRIHLLLGVAVLVGSAIPFVPTGEMVSGAAAFAVHSKLNDAVIFVICWLASVAGDLILLLEIRWGSRWVRPRLQRSRWAERMDRAQSALDRNAVSAIVTGRLVPGGRVPVLAVLAFGKFPLRRFIPCDLLACALWAAIYVALGSLGGRIAGHPVLAMAMAIAFAVLLGLLVQVGQRWWIQHHTRRT